MKIKLLALLQALVGYDAHETGLQFHVKIQDGVGPVLWPVPRPDIF